LKTGETVMAHVPSHHDHKLGEWIGIRAEVDHVVTFNRACPVNGNDLCNMPCTEHETPHDQAHSAAHESSHEQPIHFHVKPSA
jgi:hypothetical protein